MLSANEGMSLMLTIRIAMLPDIRNGRRCQCYSTSPFNTCVHDEWCDAVHDDDGIRVTWTSIEIEGKPYRHETYAICEGCRRRHGHSDADIARDAKRQRESRDAWDQEIKHGIDGFWRRKSRRDRSVS